MHKIAAPRAARASRTPAAKYEPHPAEAVVEKMIELERPSRLKGAGFYEYVDGKRTRLWPGLRETFKSGSTLLPLQDMVDRMLFAEALETQKCLDEGVLTSTADANIGSIMGIGFPPYTGGSARSSSSATRVRSAPVRKPSWRGPTELAAKYGDRFLPPSSLTEVVNRCAGRGSAELGSVQRLVPARCRRTAGLTRWLNRRAISAGSTPRIPNLPPGSNATISNRASGAAMALTSRT